MSHFQWEQYKCSNMGKVNRFMMKSQANGANMKRQPLQDNNGKAELNVFQTSIFLALIIGVPFCTFKYLFGTLAVRHGMEYHHALITFFGWLIIGWASIDVLMNLVRIYLNLRHRGSSIEFCLIAQLGRLVGRPSLFLTIDTFLSFAIICFVLWSGWIKDLRPYESYMWYAATTVNLMGLALVNIWSEFRIKPDRKKDRPSDN